jgi:hypothetical protein
MKQILLPLRHRRSPIAMQITRVASLNEREGTAYSRAVNSRAGAPSAVLGPLPREHRRQGETPPPPVTRRDFSRSRSCLLVFSFFSAPPSLKRQIRVRIQRPLNPQLPTMPTVMLISILSLRTPALQALSKSFENCKLPDV